MKRDRVYLDFDSVPIPFAPDQPSALARMLAILESSFDGIFITDHQACPIWCNHSYEIISGLTAQDVLGVPMDQLVRRGIISDSSTLKALSQNQPVTVDQTFKTGKRVLVTSTPIYDQNNQVCLVVSNVRDITEIIALQETLDHQRRLSARYQQEIAVIRDQLLHTPQMVAEDPSTLNLLRIVGRAAQLDTVVLIQGETGTGKERIASYIHQSSPRARKNFIRVNCGAIPENLAESELFGYERGAFTGANREGKAGLFEVAHEGTIFLDEVGELSLATQTKLLRVLQEKEVTRVGGSRPTKIDVRVIAATNRDLQKCVAEGTFREDLYYRLSVFPVWVPPLRERKLDIPKLANSVIGELNQTYERKNPSPPGPRPSSCNTPGRATSGSCATSWSGPSSSATGTRSRPRTWPSWTTAIFTSPKPSPPPTAWVTAASPTLPLPPIPPRPRPSPGRASRPRWTALRPPSLPRPSPRPAPSAPPPAFSI